MDKFDWEASSALTKELFSKLCALDEKSIVGLDAQNGIYIVTYDGNELGFDLWGGQGPKVVYVGISKFNSSRHFQSGSTGTSTLRRSLGALLQSRLDLVPVPRSTDILDNDRYNNYAFTPESEDKLTKWMRENFQVAFYETENENIEPLQKAMIAYHTPIFNFQNNPENKYGAQIKIWRKKCADEAKQNNHH